MELTINWSRVRASIARSASAATILSLASPKDPGCCLEEMRLAACSAENGGSSVDGTSPNGAVRMASLMMLHRRARKSAEAATSGDAGALVRAINQ